MSLVELLVTLGIVAAVGTIVASGVRRFMRTQATEATDAGRTQEMENVRSLVKQAFEGMRGTQLTSLRLQSPVAVGCRASGFCVVPGRDFAGNANAAVDQLYLVVTQPMAGEVELAAAYPAERLTLRSTSGKPLSALFSDGDFLLLARPSSSDIVRLVGKLPGAAEGIVDDSALAFDYTGRLAVKQRTVGRDYARGDAVMRASLVSLAVDMASKTLMKRDLGTGKSRPLAQDVESFKVEYSLRADDGSCPITTPPAGTYSDAWVKINADQDCYARIESLRIKYKVKGRVNVLTYRTNS